MIWAIIGLGWLGERLSQRLPSEDSFWGTHRSDFDFLRHTLPDSPHDILFLNTPPLLALSAKEYLKKIQKTSAKRIIFISSTSVFGDKQEQVDESSHPEPNSPNGIWLYELENTLRDHFGDKLLIIRPAGLIGGQRHPAYTLQGRQNISGGQDKINLIHREDLISLILETPHNIKLLHGVSSHHPMKKEYYSVWCVKLGLKPLSYLDNQTSPRVISSKWAEGLIKWHCPQLDFI